MLLLTCFAEERGLGGPHWAEVIIAFIYATAISTNGSLLARLGLGLGLAISPSAETSFAHFLNEKTWSANLVGS